MSIMRRNCGTHRTGWRVPVIMATAAVMAFPASSFAAGGSGGGGGGGGGEETTIGNNLSFPTIWSDGVQLAMRGTYGSPQLQVPFNTTDGSGNPLTLYLQGVEQNTWQAENTVATAPVDVSQVDWGDNIESRSLPLSKPIRVETTLLEDLTTPMLGFNMFSASGSKNTEVFGTDGTTYAGTQATIYSGCARLTIQRLDMSRNDPYVSALKWDPVNGQWTGKGMISEPLFNGGVWAGGEGTGYSAEINGSGKVVYGYNWTTSGLTAGDYRLTFSLDPNCPAATLNTFMTSATTVYTTTETAAALAAAGGPGGGGGAGETGGGAVAKIDATDNLSYIDVELGTPSYAPYVPPKPENTALPTITGTATQGQVLTASTGSWDNVPTSYSYQWLSCNSSGTGCASIPGATTSSYTLAAADVGHTVRVAVTATNDNGSVTATSDATSVVTPLAPVNTALPMILGSAQVGHVLLATNGSWDNIPSGYAYQWQLCDAATGSVCTNIAGANAGGYTLTDAVSGSRIRVVVTATNAGGSTAAASAPTQVVTSQLVTPQKQLRIRARITLQLRWLDGNRLHLWGSVSPARDGARLTLQLRTRTGWKTAATVTLRTRNQQSSQYSVILPRMAPGIYRAYVNGDTTHLAGNSAQIRARAQAHATLRVQHLHGLLKLTGTVSPARDGRHLMIQMRTRSGWKKVATVHLRTATRERSQFAFSVASLKPGVYRAYYGGDSLYRAGGSGLVTIR